MGKGKKKWIEKKKATTFAVVNRGGGAREVDPGGRQVVEKVLMPVKPPNLRGKRWEPGVHFPEQQSSALDEEDDDDREDEDDREEEDGREEQDDREEVEGGVPGEVGVRVGNYRGDDFELGEYGFPDDGYDYRQHFTSMGGGKFLPAALMKDGGIGGKHAIVNVDLLGAAPEAGIDFSAPKVIVVKDPSTLIERGQFSDPEEDEVLKALENSDTEDPDWQLQDDFIADAMAVGAAAAVDEGIENDNNATTTTTTSTKKKAVRFADAQFEDDEEDSDYEQGSGDDDDDDDDEDNDDGSGNDADDSFQGHAFSASSRRGVPQFKERERGTEMEKWLSHVMEKEYDDEFIGEGAEADGWSTSEHRGKKFANDLASMMDEFLETRVIPSHEAYQDGDAIDPEEKRKTVELAQRALAEGQDETVVIEVVEPSKEWDCESILSTNTNTANHPHVLNASSAHHGKQKKSATKILFADQQKPETAAAAQQASPLPPSSSSSPSIAAPSNKGSARKKQETAEEKKARKAAIKEERRAARATKKATKLVYKEEEKNQRAANDATPFFQRTVINLADH